MNDITKLQSMFQALADANRLKIILLLGDRECSVTEIVNETGLSQPLVSHHLKMLRNIQLLSSQRQGPIVYHKLKNEKILEALNHFREIASLLDSENTGQRQEHSAPWWRTKRQR